MSKETNIKLFESKQIRTLWNETEEEWYFSVVDVVGVLSESANPRRYWSDLKIKLKKEGNQLYEKFVQLKLQSEDGKYYLTDVASTEQIFRIIQSIPSPKAEPFKQWLAYVAKQRLDQLQDPELSIEQAMTDQPVLRTPLRRRGIWITPCKRSAARGKESSNVSNSVGVQQFLFFLALLFVFLCPKAFSVIIRHDKNIDEYTEYANQSKFNSVGYFSGENGNGGTFVLVAPKYILTAAHSFIDYDTEEEIIEMDGKTVTVFNSYNERVDSIKNYIFNLNGKILKGKKLIIHPNYFIDSEEDENFDIAIVELEESIDDIVIPILYDKFDEQGLIGTFVGFGASGAGNSINSELLYLKIAGKNVIDSIGGSLHLGNYCKLLSDFDDPENITPNKLGDSIPLDLEFGTGGGDSGGPLFIKSDYDELYLVGILSGGGLSLENIELNRMYGQISEWTRISTFKEWIELIIEK